MSPGPLEFITNIPRLLAVFGSLYQGSKVIRDQVFKRRHESVFETSSLFHQHQGGRHGEDPILRLGVPDESFFFIKRDLFWVAQDILKSIRENNFRIVSSELSSFSNLLSEDKEKIKKDVQEEIYRGGEG
jgi:hypothetical protein